MSEAGEKGGWEQGRAERANRIETFLGHWMIARRPSLTGEDEDILKLCPGSGGLCKAFAQKSAGISLGDETLARLLVC